MRKLLWLVSIGAGLIPASAAVSQDSGSPASRSAVQDKQAAEEAKITDLPEEEVVNRLDAVLTRVKGKAGTDFPALEAERRRKMVRALGGLPHPLTAAALKKMVTGKYQPGVRAAAAQAMGHMKFDKKQLGNLLVNRIQKNWKNDGT